MVSIRFDSIRFGSVWFGPVWFVLLYDQVVVVPVEIVLLLGQVLLQRRFLERLPGSISFGLVAWLVVKDSFVNDRGLLFQVSQGRVVFPSTTVGLSYVAVHGAPHPVS